MGPAEALAILGAGVAAGAVNAVVGSGSLITFPTLLAFGYPPVVANVSNNVGLVSGNVSGAVGYRRELAGQRPRLIRLGVIAAAGSAGGAAALLSLPSSSFQVIVPVLILIACSLVLVQPWLSRRIVARRSRRAKAADTGAGAAGSGGGPPGLPAAGREPVSPVLGVGVFTSAAYGGYFGAAQGVLVIGLLGTFLDETMQRVNGAKNVLVAVVNGVAAVIYVIFAHVAWLVVLLIAVGSTVGGALGARFGRRLPPLALRIFVVLIGVVSAVKLLFF
ncbi:MAG TPA: sulfite exporter TauE/SafE family protein [Streptosporangiaceae bacterium]|nr:sulfite exporter TauE/SafE family protein [Streptosporangiaceae bacterium]